MVDYAARSPAWLCYGTDIHTLFWFRCRFSGSAARCARGSVYAVAYLPDVRPLTYSLLTVVPLPSPERALY